MITKTFLCFVPVHNRFRWFISLLLFIIATSSGIENINTTHPNSVSGTIESCMGCSLNRLPALKTFLQSGEAESYQNVQIHWIPGSKAILTIHYEPPHHSASSTSSLTNETIRMTTEIIYLARYQSLSELHQLFQTKGFQFKTQQEIQQIKDLRKRQMELEEERMIASRKEHELKRQQLEAKRKSLEEQGMTREEILQMEQEEKRKSLQAMNEANKDRVRMELYKQQRAERERRIQGDHEEQQRQAMLGATGSAMEANEEL